MANSEDIIIPGVYSEQIEFSGRVTPTDGVYREGIPVQILQDGIILAEVYTDSQGYYSGQCDDHNEDLNNNIIAKIGDDTAQWNYVNSINLTSNSNTASAGDTITLTATVLDSNNDPASDRTVTFLNEKSESSQEIIGTAITNNSGVASVSYLVQDTQPLNIKAKSSNAESNLLIILQNVLWNPPLDGTEPTHSFNRGGSLTVANGVLSGKAGYVYGFDNVDHWKLSFEAYYTGGSFAVTDSTVTYFDTNYLQFLGGSLRVITNGAYTDYSYNGNALISNEWNLIEVEKINNQYIVSINGNIVLTNVTWSRNPSQFGVGVDSWSTNINQVKNIFVQKLK